MRRRRKLLLIIAALLVPALAFGAYWFQPWKLWTNTTVHDALPAVVSQAGQPESLPPASRPPSARPPRDVVLARGALRTHEHDTSGAVSIVRLANGNRIVAIQDLDTSEGPDVHIWLTDQRVTDDWYVFDDGFHVDLGDLKGNHGEQVYRIPDRVDIDRVRSLSIWCERFDVSFGAAELHAVR